MYWGWQAVSLTEHAPLPATILTECREKPFSYRITERLRLERVSGGIWSNPMLKQGDREEAAQDHIQTRFECLHARRFHSFPGQPVPVLSHHHSKKQTNKLLFPNFQRKPPMLQSVPSSSCYLTPGTGAWLHFLYTFPLCTYTNWWDPLQPSTLHSPSFHRSPSSQEEMLQLCNQSLKLDSPISPPVLYWAALSST